MYVCSIVSARGARIISSSVPGVVSVDTPFVRAPGAALSLLRVSSTRGLTAESTNTAPLAARGYISRSAKTAVRSTRVVLRR